MLKRYRDILLFTLAILVLLFFIGNTCPIENIVGIPCPGCNMFSALFWLFIKGNVSTALYFHPAVLFLVLYVGIILVLMIMYRKHWMNHMIFRISSIVFLMIFIGIYIYRMVVVFPQYPMQINEEAILMQLFHLI